MRPCGPLIGQVPTSEPNRPKSLPPMPTVTRSVSRVTAASWGGTVCCWKVFCAPARSLLVAPLQETSTCFATPSLSASRAG